MTMTAIPNIAQPSWTVDQSTTVIDQLRSDARIFFRKTIQNNTLKLRITYVLIVLQHCRFIALQTRLVRRQIVAIGVSVISPSRRRSDPFSSLQRFLHEEPSVFLESPFRFLLHGLATPEWMLLPNDIDGELLVRLEGSPILSKNRPPTFEIDDPHAAERLVWDLIDQVFPKYFEMLGEIALLRNTAVSQYYVVCRTVKVVTCSSTLSLFKIQCIVLPSESVSNAGNIPGS